MSERRQRRQPRGTGDSDSGGDSGGGSSRGISYDSRNSRSAGAHRALVPAATLQGTDTGIRDSDVLDGIASQT